MARSSSSCAERRAHGPGGAWGCGPSPPGHMWTRAGRGPRRARCDPARTRPGFPGSSGPADPCRWPGPSRNVERPAPDSSGATAQRWCGHEVDLAQDVWRDQRGPGRDSRLPHRPSRPGPARPVGRPRAPRPARSGRPRYAWVSRSPRPSAATNGGCAARRPRASSRRSRRQRAGRRAPRSGSRSPPRRRGTASTPTGSGRTTAAPAPSSGPRPGCPASGRRRPTSRRTRPGRWSRPGDISLSVDTDGWAPGFYVFRLRTGSGWEQQVPYVVSSPSPPRARSRSSRR